MKRGLTIVFIANIINMAVSMVTSFVLPKYLTIESYGYYKVYQLYVNYLGIAHLGFVDGIYLKYGGKEIKSIDKYELAKGSSTIRNLQIILSLIMFAVGICLDNLLVVLIAFSIVPINMISFYKSLYQATGEFEKYGLILAVLPISMFMCNIFLLFGFRTDNYVYFILVVLCSNLLLYALLEIENSKIVGRVRLFAFDVNILIEHIKSGIALTIGNLASIMITGIDRWCIRAWMEITDFSYYSFAVSVENLFNVFVSAISTTLYNYLCRINDPNEVIRMKINCIFLGGYLVALGFPAKLIIQFWLKKYEASINCLFILIGAHSFYFIIKAIYVNLYKARGKQRHYLYQMMLLLGIAVVTNIIGFYGISRTKEAFAIASLFTAIMWYSICYFEFADIRGRTAENMLPIICVFAFIFCGVAIDNAILGFLCYVSSITFIMLLFCRGSFIAFVNLVRKNLSPWYKMSKK